MLRYHMLVSGLVQGVGFRYFVWQNALRLHLTGWVKNLDSGDVELEAEGSADKLDTFIKQVEKGPRFSRVDFVKIDAIDPAHSRSFEILN